jgi:hypothetical protein
LLTVTEFARNVQWISQDPAVAAAFEAIVAGSQKPDGYLQSETFIPGGQGGIRPRYAADAPAAPLSRASAVVGALARAGGAAIQSVASRMPQALPYVAGGWARSQGWIDIKRTSSELTSTSSRNRKSPPSARHSWQHRASTGPVLPAPPFHFKRTSIPPLSRNGRSGPINGKDMTGNFEVPLPTRNQGRETTADQ